MKIHCLEIAKNERKNLNLSDYRKMIGWVEPPDKKGGTWDVTMSDGCIFECKTQETAHLVASLEEIKAMLIKKLVCKY